eukprot:3549537-Pleurochrysis_carterae.AAC.1
MPVWAVEACSHSGERASQPTFCSSFRRCSSQPLRPEYVSVLGSNSIRSSSSAAVTSLFCCALCRTPVSASKLAKHSGSGLLAPQRGQTAQTGESEQAAKWRRACQYPFTLPHRSSFELCGSRKNLGPSFWLRNIQRPILESINFLVPLKLPLQLASAPPPSIRLSFSALLSRWRRLVSLFSDSKLLFQ